MLLFLLQCPASPGGVFGWGTAGPALVEPHIVPPAARRATGFRTGPSAPKGPARSEAILFLAGRRRRTMCGGPFLTRTSPVSPVRTDHGDCHPSLSRIRPS